MTPAQRTLYFRDLWPKACQAKKWSTRDDAQRRLVTSECMQAIRGPDTDSTSDLGPDEVTALFFYLEFLATNGSDLDLSARWLDCQTDYHAFNRARQADWHQTKLYGSTGGKRLVKDRFSGQKSAEGQPLDKFDPEEIKRRHLTMATRHQKKQREQAASTVIKDDGNPF